MDIEMIKDKKSYDLSIFKKFEKILSIKKGNPTMVLSKSKSWDSKKGDEKLKAKNSVSPRGCFFVYVGPEKEKFTIKTKYANHPLFKVLLEDAELEYGYNSEGPILLPCNVNIFYKVLAEMDNDKEIGQGCGFVYGSCSPFSPAKRLRSGEMGKGYGSYGILTPSRLIKLNSFS